MDALDHDEGQVVSTNAIAMKYGLITGAACILVRLLGFSFFPIDYSTPETMVSSSIGQSGFGYLGTLAFIGIIIFAIKKHSELEGRGYTLGRGFGTGALTGLYAAVIIALFTYIYFKFIDTSMLEGMTSFMDETLQNADDGAEAADTMKTIMGTVFSPGVMSAMELLKSAIGAMIPALIGGAIFKKA